MFPVMMAEYEQLPARSGGSSCGTFGTCRKSKSQRCSVNMSGVARDEDKWNSGHWADISALLTRVNSGSLASDTPSNPACLLLVFGDGGNIIRPKIDMRIVQVGNNSTGLKLLPGSCYLFSVDLNKDANKYTNLISEGVGNWRIKYPESVLI